MVDDHPRRDHRSSNSARCPTSTPPNIGPDGTLVAANLVGDITEYDLDTLQPLGSFPASAPSSPSAAADSSSATTAAILMARSHDRTVSIYDVASRTRLGDPIPSGSTARQPRSAPTAWPSPSASGNGIIIWDLDPEHLAAAACRLAGRNLTPTEWDTHLAGLGDYRPTCPEHT